MVTLEGNMAYVFRHLNGDVVHVVVTNNPEPEAMEELRKLLGATDVQTTPCFDIGDGEDILYAHRVADAAADTAVTL